MYIGDKEKIRRNEWQKEFNKGNGSKKVVNSLFRPPPSLNPYVEKNAPTSPCRFEGMTVDLAHKLAKLLHFNYTFKLVDDGKVDKI